MGARCGGRSGATWWCGGGAGEEAGRSAGPCADRTGPALGARRWRMRRDASRQPGRSPTFAGGARAGWAAVGSGPAAPGPRGPKRREPRGRAPSVRKRAPCRLGPGRAGSGRTRPHGRERGRSPSLCVKGAGPEGRAWSAADAARRFPALPSSIGVASHPRTGPGRSGLDRPRTRSGRSRARRARALRRPWHLAWPCPGCRRSAGARLGRWGVRLRVRRMRRSANHDRPCRCIAALRTGAGGEACAPGC
jgi:hypothetical protein